ncbi:hypothetical protein [Pectobacterium araliae]|uniref:hypothetical protein n=1 Tax=Pectobacterium araliae TaxID=3073862 RepID=UPI0021C44DE3
MRKRVSIWQTFLTEGHRVTDAASNLFCRPSTLSQRSWLAKQANNLNNKANNLNNK